MKNAILGEFHDAWKRRDLCFHLALGEIRSRHSRSILGVLWIPLSTGLFVGIMGSLYATLFGRDPAVYFPHMTAGYIIWQVLDAGIRDGKQKLIASRSVILQIPIGILTLSFELTAKIVLIFLYNIPVFLIVLFFYPVPFDASTLGFLFGLGLVIFTLVPVIVTASVIGLRFRDLNQLLDSVMRVSFFLTPVIWMPDMVGNRGSLSERQSFLLLHGNCPSPSHGDGNSGSRLARGAGDNGDRYRGGGLCPGALQA